MIGWQITVAVMDYRIMNVQLCTELQSMIGWQIIVAVMEYRIMHVHCTSKAKALLVNRLVDIATILQSGVACTTIGGETTHAPNLHFLHWY